MEEDMKSENHLTSAAAFVEGGIQDACDDACSICLEAFCDSDPSTVTGCKHEFHLQCILEWCQRSSQCPMCWQLIRLKDPGSQELLDAVEHERSIRMNPPRSTTIFHHPTLGDFELQHLPVNATDSEFEERIIQHLAAAAAMGRARHGARREGQRIRSSAQGRPHFLVFSTHSNAPVATSTQTRGGEGEPSAADVVSGPNSSFVTVEEESTPVIATTPTHTDPFSASGSRSSLVSNQHGVSSNRRSPSQPSPHNQEKAGPSDFQSLSESLKSRFSAVSARYKESITKSTKSWKDKWFSRSSSTTADLGSEVRRKVNAGVATISHMMEFHETRDSNRADTTSVSNSLEGSSSTDRENQQILETSGHNNALSENNIPSPCTAGSAST